MVTEKQAAEWILDCDGSSREVTFTPTSKPAIIAFVHYLLDRYHVDSAFDNKGIDRSQQLHTVDPSFGTDGFIHIVLSNGKGMIPSLQLFIDEDQDTGKYCLEVTFFSGRYRP